MVNTDYTSKMSPWLSRAALFGAVLAPFGSIAIAQSPASLATMPYPPNTIALPPAAVLPVAPVRLYKGPPPVVMFRGTPPIIQLPPTDEPPVIEFVDPPPLAQNGVSPRPYSIINTAQRDADATRWNPANLEAVIAPPVVSGVVAGSATVAGEPDALVAGGSPPRGPIRRILRDTRRAIVRDLPEAVADALPWVDRDAKSEPFDEVLDRVSDDLQRAAQGDPAWALPAQREIRALSQRLDLLPSPPPLSDTQNASRPTNVATGVDDRPFRPRPIWPGASGRPEAQVRPVTLVTTTGQQNGPRVAGIATRYIPAAEDDDGMPVTRAPPRTQSPARRGAARRPLPKSR